MAINMIITLFLIAVGLSMDAFSVSVTNGLCENNIKLKKMLLIGVFFGGAQAIMPVIGFYAGSIFAGYIESVDHWIAFILLGLIGIKMIIEAFENKEEENEKRTLTIKMLFFQAVATSIDALAVGISFAALKMNIFIAASFIGIVTFLLSVCGVFIGKKAGGALKEKAEIIGGIILVLIGAKILIEHLFF